MPIGRPVQSQSSNSPTGIRARCEGRMASKTNWRNAEDWRLRPLAETATARRRRGMPSTGPVIPPQFIADGVSVSEVVDAEPRAERRSEDAPFIDLSVPVAGSETYALAIRHPSGALTFHFGEQEFPRRGTRAAAARAIRFQVP